MTNAPGGEVPMIRRAARVLLIDARERLLLFKTFAGGAVERGIWITPGGGVKDGETHEEAAGRELWEETGVVAELGPCVWVRQHTFRFGGRLLDEREQIFVVRVEGAVVHNANWEPEEHDFLAAHHWWSLDEIIGSDEWFVPRRLCELLPDIIAGRYPAEPIDCGR